MGLIHPGVLVAALSATAALAFCNLAAATCCSGGVAPYTVVLDWEVNTTNNASGPPAGSPWFDYPQQTYSQLRLYIANNPPVQFMQLHIGCSDGSPLTDLKVDFNAGGLILNFGGQFQMLAGDGESVLLMGGNDENYIASQAIWEMPLLVALVSLNGELDACTAGVCVNANKSSFAEETAELDRNLLMDLREECIALQLPSANNNTCPPNLLGICPDDCVTICGTPEDDIIYATPSGTYEVNQSLEDATCYCVFGRAGADTIYGSDSSDTIYGQSGFDVIYGRGGNDVIYGGNGKDTIYGNIGDDRIFGGMGKDWLYGNAGNDDLFGNLHRDWLMGGEGMDVMGGGKAKDTYNLCWNDTMLNLSEHDIVNSLTDNPFNWLPLDCWHFGTCMGHPGKQDCWWRCPTTGVVYGCNYGDVCSPSLFERDYCLEEQSCLHPPNTYPYWCPNEFPHSFCVAPPELQGSPFSLCNGVSFPGEQPQPLKGVEEITGFLTVFEQGLQHPSELGSADLTLVQGYIYLWDNEQLQDLEGLEKLQAVHGALHMYGNGLTSLTGLYSLTSLGGLNMASNDLLGSLEGLTALQKVNGEVYIGNSQILDLHGLEQVQEVNGSLTLTSNENMQSLNGLSSLTSLQELRVASNPMLQSLTGVNSSLTSLHWLTIAYNDVLDSLDGLAALNSVDGRIFIGYNPSLCQTEAEAFVVAIATGGFGQEVEVINNSPC
mmetsp:Transcript_11917/g.43605  ORF Transcript_11917/g.43605 Transcript_11917/m.43605 type:complete len:717 (-) Transcript_11917:201-2351(-)